MSMIIERLRLVCSRGWWFMMTMANFDSVKTKIGMLLLCLKFGLGVFFATWFLAGNWDDLLELLVYIP